jgi:hypothetical protein
LNWPLFGGTNPFVPVFQGFVPGWKHPLRPHVMPHRLAKEMTCWTVLDIPKRSLKASVNSARLMRG